MSGFSIKHGHHHHHHHRHHHHHTAKMSSSSTSRDVWRSNFKAAIRDVGDGQTFTESAEELRKLIQENLLQLRDIVTGTISIRLDQYHSFAISVPIPISISTSLSPSDHLHHHLHHFSDPEKFFEAHRLLAAHATRMGPGFWIRFSVHFNLFAGIAISNVITITIAIAITITITITRHCCGLGHTIPIEGAGRS